MLQVANGIVLAIVGLVFLLAPVQAAGFLGMDLRNGDGIVEIRAFYGAMEIGAGLFVLMSPTDSALLFVSCFLSACAMGRIGSVQVQLGSTSMHLWIAMAETSGAIISLWALSRENAAKAADAMARANLTRRQIPNPTKLADFVPFCSENLQDPYPFYKALRDEAPIYKAPGLDYYLISRASDVHAIAKDHETFSSNLVAILLQGRFGSTSGTATLDRPAIFSNVGVVDVLALQDPPIHTVQRKIAFAGLTPKLFAAMEDSIRAQAVALIQQCKLGEPFDFMDTVALRLPMFVALDLCGFPSDEKTAREVKYRADHGVALLSIASTPDEFATHIAEASQLFVWIQDRFREQLANGATTDFSRALVDAVKVRALTQAEAESIYLQILLAGNDSSAATMGNAMNIMCGDSVVQATLRENPSKIVAFVEEVLRFESPFGGHFRKVMFDTEYNGVHFKKGDRVMLLWGSANRDERCFENPDVFDMTKTNRKSHYSFGSGIHQCLGNSLARREVRILVEELLKRFSKLELAKPSEAPKPFYVPSNFTRSLARLHVKCHE